MPDIEADPAGDYWWRQRVEDALFASHAAGHRKGGAESCWYCEAEIDVAQVENDARAATDG